MFSILTSLDRVPPTACWFYRLSKQYRHPHGGINSQYHRPRTLPPGLHTARLRGNGTVERRTPSLTSLCTYRKCAHLLRRNCVDTTPGTCGEGDGRSAAAGERHFAAQEPAASCCAEDVPGSAFASPCPSLRLRSLRIARQDPLGVGTGPPAVQCPADAAIVCWGTNTGALKKLLGTERSPTREPAFKMPGGLGQLCLPGPR